MSEILESKSEINTNMTMVELKGSVVGQLTKLSDEEIKTSIDTIENFLNEQPQTLNYLMLLSNELRYYTTFELNTVLSTHSYAEEIVKFLLEDSFFQELGGLKLVEAADGHVEIWVGNNFFALFNYDSFIVTI